MSTLLVLLIVPAGIVLGVLLAVTAHRRLRGIKFFQTVFASTVASSSAVTAVVFLTLVNPQGATLIGGGPIDVADGFVRFNNLRITKVGTGYTLLASSGGLTTTVSTSFNILPAPAATHAVMA